MSASVRTFFSVDMMILKMTFEWFVYTDNL